MKLIDLQQGTDAWLKWRLGGIGASEAPMVMGISPHKTAFELWLEKTGKKAPGFVHQGMLRGIKLEPKARAWYEEKMKIMVIPRCVEHDVYPHLRASLDGLDIFGAEYCEIKCPSWKDHEMALNGIVPPYYWCQMQYQMMVTGLLRGHYVSFDGEDGVVLEVVADKDYQMRLLDRVTAFWDCCELDQPPVTDEWDSLANNYLTVMYDRDLAEEGMKAIGEQLVKLIPEGSKNHQGGGLKVAKIAVQHVVNWNKVAEAALGFPIDPEGLAHLLVGLIGGKEITPADIEAGTVVKKESSRITPEKGYTIPVVTVHAKRVDNPFLMNAANEPAKSTAKVASLLDW